MNEKKIDVLLRAVRWLIQRGDTRSEFREVFNDSMIDKIDEVLNPKQSEEEPCCEMPEEELGQ